MADAEAWGAAGTKYQIHEETFSAFRHLQAMGFKRYEEMTPEELRAASLRKSEVLGGHVDFVGSETEIVVPSEGNKDGVPVSVYKPAQLGPVPPILVYFHGGGFVTGSRNVYTTVLKTLAKCMGHYGQYVRRLSHHPSFCGPVLVDIVVPGSVEVAEPDLRAECIVVNVEYRLAPVHKIHAAVDDCRTVARWVLAKKTVVGGKEGSQVGIGGDSAGGLLTASVSHDVPGLAFQLLVYPHTDLTLSFPSFSEFTDTPGLNLNTIHWFMGLFLDNDGQKTDPVVSPYHHLSFSPRLPPALCILAELDPLRDDGLAYCRKLKEAGVPTDMLMVKGATHGFFHLAAHYKELTKEPYDRCVQFLRQFQKA